MRSPTALRVHHHDLISVLIIASVMNFVIVSGNSNHCKDRKFPSAFNTTYMQFTKEIVSQEYAIEGEFKNLHCCAKGYRSIEWLKDGKRYPWSTEDTSSLILYPQAANQTIFARHASKVDEGRYTCVLRNDTHKIEHHMQLKVLDKQKDSSPDVPLATFTPSNQFADVGGSARFFCEAFVGKKDLADIVISIRWYHVVDDSEGRAISDDQQEIVKREEEQIIGSYLTIRHVTVSNYGRYMCRVEIGNSPAHRLEMSAELINVLAIKADTNNILVNPYFLASCAAVITVALFFLVIHTQQCCRRHLINKDSNELEILNMKTLQSTNQKLKKPSKLRVHSFNDDSRIMIDVV